MSHVSETIDIDVPVRVAYDQWTQFEEFPQFMEGVQSVRQLDDTHLHWIAEIGGVQREWDATIVEQRPDEVVSWHSDDGPVTTGAVTFSSTGPESSKVTLAMDFDPSGLVEQVGDKLGIVRGRVHGDLERFRDFISSRGTETGAWRGTVHNARPLPD